jgi:GMP synthase (glutamine-hydrolysing)
MALPRVLILRHVLGECIGSVVEVLQASGVEPVVWDLANGEERNFQPSDWAGLVVMGGPMNVDQADQFPFLDTEVRWLREALRVKLPTLGICLGAQLLAKSLGARVYANPEVEMGFREIEILSAGKIDPLLSDIENPLTVCHWHGDTYELPPGCVLLATNEACRHQAFRFCSYAWAIQFHVEINIEQLTGWMKASKAKYGTCAADRCTTSPEELELLLQQIEAKMPSVQILGRRIIGRFAKLCRETSRACCNGNGQNGAANATIQAPTEVLQW